MISAPGSGTPWALPRGGVSSRRCPPSRAFRVFTEQFDQIKPREHNLLAPEAIAERVFETRVGGHVYDRGENGSICRWARVLAFDPPRRLVISWDISPTWQLVTDPAEASEVEITFTAEGPDQTRVDLVHRHFGRQARAGIRSGTVSPARVAGPSTCSGTSTPSLPDRQGRGWDRSWGGATEPGTSCVSGAPSAGISVVSRLGLHDQPLVDYLTSATASRSCSTDGAPVIRPASSR